MNPIQIFPCAWATLFPSLTLGLELGSSLAQGFSYQDHLGSCKDFDVWTTETVMKLVYMGCSLSKGIFQNCPSDPSMWPRSTNTPPATGSEGEDFYWHVHNETQSSGGKKVKRLHISKMLIIFFSYAPSMSRFSIWQQGHKRAQFHHSSQQTRIVERHIFLGIREFY